LVTVVAAITEKLPAVFTVGEVPAADTPNDGPSNVKIRNRMRARVRNRSLNILFCLLYEEHI
jgi:hypothetical protein